MPIAEYKEDIFKSPVQTLVCPVNTVGAMGLGLAKDFRDRVPGLYKAYKALCTSGQFTPNKIWRYKWEATGQYVICLPTKEHWRGLSELDMIVANMEWLTVLRERLQITSIAVPPLGCGAGGLDYEREVKPKMIEILGTMPIEVRIVLGEE